MVLMMPHKHKYTHIHISACNPQMDVSIAYQLAYQIATIPFNFILFHLFTFWHIIGTCVCVCISSIPIGFGLWTYANCCELSRFVHQRFSISNWLKPIFVVHWCCIGQFIIGSFNFRHTPTNDTFSFISFSIFYSFNSIVWDR